MSKSAGFLPLRRGLWEHIRDGRMSITEALAFIYICSEADTRAGIWKGSAKSLSGELSVAERTARDVLERLECSGYIRRFAVPGRHICYPILVHKYLITNGEHTGERLNAIDSTSPSDLAYFPREEVGLQNSEKSVERSVERNVERSASQKRSKTREPRNENRDSELRTCELILDNREELSKPSQEKEPRSKKNSVTGLKRTLSENILVYMKRNHFQSVAEFLCYDPKSSGSHEDWKAKSTEYVRRWRAACDSLAYEVDFRDQCLCYEFLDIVEKRVEKSTYYETTPARICARILDECRRETPLVPFPPSFLDHKRKLSEAEKLSS